MFTDNELRHIASALRLAIADQRMYERDTLHYTMDSGQVGAWVEILHKIRDQEPGAGHNRPAPVIARTQISKERA